MTCSESAVNALGLCKQDNTNSTCAADMKQIIIWLVNHPANKITEIITVQSKRPVYPDHANETTQMVYADDTGHIIM